MVDNGIVVSVNDVNNIDVDIASEENVDVAMSDQKAYVIGSDAIIYNTQRLANAIVGSVNEWDGSAVAFDDVSPLAHNVSVTSNGYGISTIVSLGKNLLHTNSFTAEDFRNLNTQNKTFSLFEGSITGDFTLSFTDNLGGTSQQQFIVYVLDGVHNGRGKGWGSVFKFSGTLTSIYLSGISNPPSGSLDDIQLEVGTKKTAFEPYKEGESLEVAPNASVEFKSISPNMTLYCNDGIGDLHEIKYNKDTNIVIEKLTQAIISLGGNM